MKHKKWISLLLVVVVAAAVYCILPSTRNNIFWSSVELDRVREVKITFVCFFQESEHYEYAECIITDRASIRNAADMENIIRKNDGVNRLEKCTPWQVVYKYEFIDGAMKERVYRGQHSEALTGEYMKIPEIAAVLE